MDAHLGVGILQCRLQLGRRQRRKPLQGVQRVQAGLGRGMAGSHGRQAGHHRPVLPFHQQAMGGETPPDVGVGEMGGQPLGSLASHLYRSCGPGRRRSGHDPVDPPHAVAAVEVYVLLEGFRH